MSIRHCISLAVASNLPYYTGLLYAFLIAVLFFLTLATLLQARAQDDIAAALHNAPRDLVINDDSKTNDTMPSLAVMSDGSTWAAWHAYRDRYDRVLARRLGPGGLGKIQQISGPESINEAPVLVALDNGTAWIFWETLRDERPSKRSEYVSPADIHSPHIGISDGSSHIQARWRLMGRQLKRGKWQTAVVLSEKHTNAMMPAASSLGNGRLLLAWLASGKLAIAAGACVKARNPHRQKDL
jgi:hypothetical protein